MTRLLAIVCAALLAVAAAPEAAFAQAATSKVVTACGGQSYTAGQNQYPTMDLTGVACAGGGGTIVVIPSSAAAAAIVPVVSTTLESCHVLKASAGNLYSLAITIQAVSGVVQVFNATSAPVDGAVTPVWSSPIISNGTFGGGSWQWQVPMRLGTGVTVCFSSATTPFTKTASATSFISGNVQ